MEIRHSHSKARALPVLPCPLTWGAVVHQGTQGFAILPVPVEVGDGQLRNFVLDPAQEPLLRGLLLGIFFILILPHGHGDGVMKDQGPYQAKDQFQVPVHNSLAVC